MESENKSIVQKEVDKDLNMQTIQFARGSYITIPYRNNDGEVIPLVDPVENATGWIKVPNDVMDSQLSMFAKMTYIGLRRCMFYDTGFTFIAMEKPKGGQKSYSDSSNFLLTDITSIKSRTTLYRAIKELEYFGLIKVTDFRYYGNKRNLYQFMGQSNWSLPTKENKGAEKYKQHLAKVEQDKLSKERQQIIDDELSRSPEDDTEESFPEDI